MSRIFGFAKLRNETVRDGNVYSLLENFDAMGLDGGVVCDDASTDGTTDILRRWAKDRGWVFYGVEPAAQDFAKELEVKQRMLDELAPFAPDWVLWQDGDEVLDARGTAGLRAWVESLAPHVKGGRMHYVQAWRSLSWARTDDGFDDGFFLKLWRWSLELTFDPRPGTHRSQFPLQIPYADTPIAPFDLIHLGNARKRLQFKAHQYNDHGLGGVDRHLAFGHTPEESLATGEGYDLPTWSRPNPTYRRIDVNTLPAGIRPKLTGEGLELAMETSDGVDVKVYPPPQPFTMDEIRRIRSMGNLRGLPGWFTVVVPAFNRAKDLPKALESLLAQRYEKWIALVLDDGSTDETMGVMNEWELRDPRIFYCRYEENRGGVAMNEIGMAMACEMTEFWSRLGSDDWWGPGKLEADAEALRTVGVDAVFGPFSVWKHGKADHVCAGTWSNAPGTPSERLRRGEFLASWANVAVRTSVLARVREHWGNFVDPRLRNQEDFLFNSRVAKLGIEWVWRPGDATDAWWRCLEGVGAPATASASADADTTGRDTELTRRLIVEE